jgi:pyruvate dehydrogenase complex dehydrogenase (E1) component
VAGALNSVVEFDGADRVAYLLEELIEQARKRGVPVPHSANTCSVPKLAAGAATCKVTREQAKD